MEICDGPIIRDESCLNCIHSVETKKGGIACGDRGAFLRFFMGLRHIERPNVECCNRFDQIPSTTEKLCKYCEHYSIHHDMPSCFNISLVQLAIHGPRRVSPTGTCSSFELCDLYRQRRWNGR